jgi:hypothetical protein
LNHDIIERLAAFPIDPHELQFRDEEALSTVSLRKPVRYPG